MTPDRSQLVRMLKERRGALLYDMRRLKERECEIADELSETERAITELENGEGAIE